MKTFEYEYVTGNEPDTTLIFITANDKEEAFKAMSEYDDEMSIDDLYEVDVNSKYYKVWANTRSTQNYIVSGGELVRRSMVPSRRIK